MNTKICTNCKIERLISHFYYNSYRKKYESTCNECGKIRCKNWRLKNPEKNKLSHVTSKLKLKLKNPALYRIIKLMASMRSRYHNKKMIKNITSADLLDIYEKQNGKCFYTGIQMKLESNTERDLFLMSIDRIDSNIGYIKENVVLCCWGLNVLKGPHSNDDLFKSLKEFYEGAKSIGKIL